VVSRRFVGDTRITGEGRLDVRTTDHNGRLCGDGSWERTGPVDEMVTVRIEETEWEEVTRRLRFSLEADERDPLGNFGLVLRGGRRRWWSTDSYRLVVLDAGPDEGDATLVVSPRLIEAFPLVAAGSGAALLRIDRSGPRPTISIEGPGGALCLDHHDLRQIELDQILGEQLQQAGVSFTVDAEALHETIRLARIAPAGPFLDEDREEPLMWLSVTHDRLDIAVGWAELGTTRYSIPITASGEAAISASPAYLHELLKALEPGEANFTIPDDVNDTVRVRQGAVTALLMPIDPTRGTVRHVEEVLSVVFGDDVVHTDADGDYPLSVDGTPVYARVMAGDPIRLGIYAVVLDDVALSEDLLAELNQLNASTGMVKVVWREGAVLALGELVAATLDAEEVIAVHQRVGAFADDLGPALAARFGGRAQTAGLDERWAGYGQARLHAELVPGEWLALNGPDATDAFPFTSPVYVITAHNPRGRRRPADVNEHDNARLAADLVSVGAGFVRAVGGSEDGSWSEASFLAWGIDEDTALRLGAAYGQDAIFELTADRCTILGVTVPRREERPRRMATAT
jgi:hypothetical protein